MQSKQYLLTFRDQLSRMRTDVSGNTLAMIAAALLPLLALVGGGVDMGRSYLSQSRLQQACDAGVLAARKKLGSSVVTTGTVPAEVETIGNRFFNINFRSGAYGTRNRSFEMTLEDNYAISGEATVDVPTTIMTLFGYNNVDIAVQCEAQLNFSNTDIMFVLDTTGSMAETNPGDSSPKIDILRRVVKNFHAQLEGSKAPGTRLRYGFVPYSTNVNVGGLLKSDWVVDRWYYNGRKAVDTGLSQTYVTYETTYTYISGSQAPIASYSSATCPADTAVWETLAHGFNPDGSEYGTTRVNGSDYYCNAAADAGGVTVGGNSYSSYTYSWVTKATGTATKPIYMWSYMKMPIDVRFTKGANGNAPLKPSSISVQMGGYPSPNPDFITANFYGCIEERDTYEITDYDDVDLALALDLDIDLVPTKNNPRTQWRPVIHEISFEPEIWWDGSGTFRSPAVTANEYLMAGWAGLSACPAPARKMAEMDASAVASYVDSLQAAGSTYHDIGMIWGGRLLSPTGLFAAENADTPNAPVSRHLIYLTDGVTAPLQWSYGAYGIEPLDRRRATDNSTEALKPVVEGRFGVACNEVKKRNITVWVIGFGTTLNPIMTECAGQGHYFEASDAAELQDVFSKIAAQMGDLRINK